jgi:hypothetical protein
MDELERNELIAELLAERFGGRDDLERERRARRQSSAEGRRGGVRLGSPATPRARAMRAT